MRSNLIPFFLAAAMTSAVASSQQPARPSERGPIVPSSGPAAVTPAVSLYGTPCGAPCASLNAQGGTVRKQTLPNEYCYGHKFSAATTVVGFQLFTETVSLPRFTMTCAVYRASGNVPSGTAVAMGRMTVQRKADWYAVKLDKPVAVKAGETIWISQYDTTSVRPAEVVTGSTPSVGTYWRRPAGSGSWSLTGIIKRPAWRILCVKNTALYHTGTPKIGGSMSLDIVMPGSGAAFVLVGIKNPDLPIPGFCARALTSAEASLTRPVVNGSGSWKFTVPNDPSFDGKAVFCQTWMVAGGTLVGTNGAALFFGK